MDRFRVAGSKNAVLDTTKSISGNVISFASPITRIYCCIALPQPANSLCEMACSLQFDKCFSKFSPGNLDKASSTEQRLLGSETLFERPRTIGLIKADRRAFFSLLWTCRWFDYDFGATYLYLQEH
jgi:hypothetical protein